MNTDDPARASVLAVEDNLDIHDLLTDLLEDIGVHVECVTEREQAEALLVHRHYDVLIADLHLTKLNTVEGLDVLDFARYQCPGIRLVVFTGDRSASVREEAMRRGADAVLTKPCAAFEIARTIEELISAPARGRELHLVN